MKSKYFVWICLVMVVLLNINLIYAATGRTSVVFYRTNSDYLCIITSLLDPSIVSALQLTPGSSYWYKSNTDYSNSNGYCYHSNRDVYPPGVIQNWDHGCCPSGGVCDRVTGFCNATVECRSLSRDNCNGSLGPPGVELYDQGVVVCSLQNPSDYGDKSPSICKNSSYCVCEWNNTAGTNGLCQPKKKFVIQKKNDNSVFSNKPDADSFCFNSGGSSGLTNQPLGTCTYDIDSSGRALCEQGADFYEVKWTAIWSGTSANRPADCPTTPQSITVSCEKVLMLNFFTPINIIGAILIIFIIYFLIHLKGKKVLKK